MTPCSVFPSAVPKLGGCHLSLLAAATSALRTAQSNAAVDVALAAKGYYPCDPPYGEIAPDNANPTPIAAASAADYAAPPLDLADLGISHFSVIYGVYDTSHELPTTRDLSLAWADYPYDPSNAGPSGYLYGRLGWND